ncbi:MAG: FGGY-family carbohydrate kinase [Lachnospiraceae bacterium]|nr:FGGY-family carbohydrate kinase [Lachnospiraceae bacterium]
MDDMKKTIIENGEAVLGIELGSTRIKAVLIGRGGQVLATGGFDWENQLKNGIWTYDLKLVNEGLQAAYADLAAHVKADYGVTITTLKAMGISAMMHGYLALDKQDGQLAEFRTWRNNITEEAADILTEKLNYNIPQRWSIAHLYQAVLNGEAHVKDVAYITTLSGYVHYLLTGCKVLGVGDASGMFPIDIDKKDFNSAMLDEFDALMAPNGFGWKIRDIMPKVLVAGEEAGVLTEAGAALLDKSGMLKAGIPLCPPEGDAGTGMVATNCVAKRTGNVSAGTSAFAMLVLEKELSKVYRQLDMVTTPDGALVAMAHSQNCTTEINNWMDIFEECLKLFGVKASKGEIFEKMFTASLAGDKDGGGLLPYCFHSGEHGVGLNEGMPLFMHPAGAAFNLANFIRSQLYTCFGAMKLGMDILMKEEHVVVDKILGHGGIFKTKGVAQTYLAAAMETPVVIMDNAGEGGAWGIALLAEYLDRADQPLAYFLNEEVFANTGSVQVDPDEDAIAGYAAFMTRYKAGLPAEKAAVEAMKTRT